MSFKRMTIGFLLALILAGALGLAAGGGWAGRGWPAAWAAAPSPSALEAATIGQLSALEAALRAQLQGQAAGDQGQGARMALIKLSMWGPLADVTGWFLATLGDSRTARRAFAWLMPFIKWMCEPFLLVVDNDDDELETAAEIDKIFAFVAREKAKGLLVSLDNVGDASLSPEDARQYRAYYLGLIGRFAAGQAPFDELNVSLKLSALVHDLDAALDGQGRSARAQAKRAEIAAALVELLRAAAAPDKKVFIRIDMEEYAYKDMTLALFRQVVEQNRALALDGQGDLRLGVVIQAYLRDAAPDVAALAAWARAHGFRAPIRLVKGAYLEHERALAAGQGLAKSPVWDNKPSTDANYEALAEVMLRRADAIKPAFGTHNLRTIARVMAVADALGLERHAYELQMLHGMGDPIKRVVVDAGRLMREYVPAGTLARGLKYAGRRFAELAGGQNALARSMRGDFSVFAGAPAFEGERDIADGRATLALLAQTRAGH